MDVSQKPEFKKIEQLNEVEMVNSLINSPNTKSVIGVSMPRIRSIEYRRILNSHVNFTNEFIIRLDNGEIGIGGSPQGETISIYEDKNIPIDPKIIINTIEQDGYLGKSLDQASFDNYLQGNIPRFGRNNSYGLSLAFYNATHKDSPVLKGQNEGKYGSPHICFNILNGGKYAYTNPILSDFPEYLLVSKTIQIADAIAEHNEIQRVVKNELLKQEKTLVSSNPVACFSTRDNRECIDFLLNILDSLGYSDRFELMIDASAGDLYTDDGYQFPITDSSVFTPGEFFSYWKDIIDNYELRILEDPFHEQDMENWFQLTNSQNKCRVIGDNFYSSDFKRIEEGAAKKYSDGVIIKPNQAGTVTSVEKAIETAKTSGQEIITSHRSISTESTFLSTLTCKNNVEYIKIGPLMTDYSSIVRLNEIIRYTEEPICHK
ncbi:MAG: hypothetical protein ACK2U1_05290 [Anaerolineales bacterium]